MISTTSSTSTLGFPFLFNATDHIWHEIFDIFLETTKVWLFETCWSCFTLLRVPVLLAVLAKFWDKNTDNLKRKEGFPEPFCFRIQMCTNGSKTWSRVSSTLDFDVPSQRHFFQLSLAVNLQRHRKPMSPFHLTNRSRSATKPVRMHTLIATETSRNDCWIPAVVVLPHRHDLDGISALVVPIRRLTQHQFTPPIQQWGQRSSCIGTAGGEVLGQAAINGRLEGGQMSPTNMVTVASNKILLGQIFLASLVLQPPQTRYISVLNHIIQCLFCWAWLEMTCFNKLGK